MPRSIVDSTSLSRIRASFETYASATDSATTAFRANYNGRIKQFESKLEALYIVLQQKQKALDRCELRRRHDDGHSCAAEESACRAAEARYGKCLTLVAEARAAIKSFEAQANQYTAKRNDLLTRAYAGLAKVSHMLDEYSAETMPPIAALSGGMLTVSSGGLGNLETRNDVDDPTQVSGQYNPGRAMSFIVPDEMKGMIVAGDGDTAITIDLEAMSSIYDRDVVAPDYSEIKTAAAALMGLGAAGIVAGGIYASRKHGQKRRLMDNSERSRRVESQAREIFRRSTGVDFRKLLIQTGNPRQQEYVDTYNKILKDLIAETKEIDRQEILKNLENVHNRMNFYTSDGQKEIKDFASLNDVERYNADTTLAKNLQNDLKFLDDNIRRPEITAPVTRFGGLSKDGLRFMFDKMPPKRFLTITSILKASDVTFIGETNKEYCFTQGNEVYSIARDGSYISHALQKEPSGAAWDYGGPDFGYETDHKYARGKFAGNAGGSLASGGFKFNADRIETTIAKYWIFEDGSAAYGNMDANLGPDAHAGAEISSGGSGAHAGAEIASGKAGLCGITSPNKSLIGDSYSQEFIGVEAGAHIGAGVGAKFGGGKAESKLGLFSLAFKYKILKGNLSDFPDDIREPLRQALR